MYIKLFLSGNVIYTLHVHIPGRYFLDFDDPDNYMQRINKKCQNRINLKEITGLTIYYVNVICIVRSKQRQCKH